MKTRRSADGGAHAQSNFASIDITGAYHTVDAIACNRFKVDDLRDGVGLRTWALQLAAVDPIAEQIKAVKELAQYPSLRSSDGVTQVQLEMHMNGLLLAWLKVEGNSPTTKINNFRARLLGSLPDEPVTSKVAVI